MPMAIPHYIVLWFISMAGGVILFLSWWAILFTARYPDVFFNFVTWWLCWLARLTGYAYLLTDKYPPFSGREEADYPVVFRVEPPGKLSRLTTFFRFPIVPTWTWAPWDHCRLQWQSAPGMPMAIPHYIVLWLISMAGGVILFLSWWAILFTARYPEVFLNFITWWLCWLARLTGYAYLVTDKYPPFSGGE